MLIFDLLEVIQNNQVIYGKITITDKMFQYQILNHQHLMQKKRKKQKQKQEDQVIIVASRVKTIVFNCDEHPQKNCSQK